MQLVMKKQFLIIMLFFVALGSKAQVAVNTTGNAPDSSSILDVQSDSLGMLIPRMTAAQRDSIHHPALGLMVFVTSDSTFYYYKTEGWIKVGRGASGWDKNGDNVFTFDNVDIGTRSSDYPDGRLNVTLNSEKIAGIFVVDSGTDTLEHWNIVSSSTGNGSGVQVGSYNYNDNMGDGFHCGTINQLFNDGNGNQIGSYNYLKTGSTLNKSIYGTFNYLSGTDSTEQYGSYNEIFYDSSCNFIGNRYGVYSKALGPNAFAGYFEGRLYVSDSLGLGVSNPAARLDVNGSLRYSDGHQGNGLVLTSDADGNAAWADGDTVNAGGWIVNNNYIYNTTDSVGIGTDSPDAKLAVNSSSTEKSVSIHNYTASSSSVYGIYNTLNGTVSGSSYGILNNIQGNGTGIQYGTKNYISNTGDSTHYGTYNELSGSGTGDHYGFYSYFNGSGNGNQYGNMVYMNNLGSGTHYGFYSYFNGSGNGNQYGNMVYMNNLGSGTHYGTYNVMAGNGTGTNYGSYTVIYGLDNEDQYGNMVEVINSGSGAHYGTYNHLYGQGTGNKYGSYNKIESYWGGGTQYGVYSEVSGSDNYAGYFDGNVAITGNVTTKIKAPVSGDADLKAYIYGSLRGSDALIYTSESSSGFTAAKNGTGVYVITFTESGFSTKAYLVFANAYNGSQPVTLTYVKDLTKCTLYAWDKDGNLVDTLLNFEIIKK